jgi:hypothetical protein
LAEGETRSGEQISWEVGFNADVLPKPTITSISPASGAAGTSVAISGFDFEEVKGVTFGGTVVPYTVDSQSQITAVAPSVAASAVNVAVTTLAGTANSPQAFIYQGPSTAQGGSPASGGSPAAAGSSPPGHCVVPRLTGWKLKASKKKLRKADCKVGKVEIVGDAIAKTGNVISQNPKPGRVLAAGSKVSVKLG